MARKLPAKPVRPPPHAAYLHAPGHSRPVIDFRLLSGQLDGFADYRRAEDGRHAARLDAACDALGGCDEWEALTDARRAATSGPLRALPTTDPRGRTSPRRARRP